MDIVNKPVSTAQVMTGLAVMFGWFAAAAAALVWWISRQSSDIPDEDCAGWCSSDRFDMTLAAVFLGIPAAAVGLTVGAFVLAYLIRRTGSGAVAGSVAGLAGLLAGPIVVFCVVSARG